MRSISDRFGGDLDAEARYWTARIESDVAELTDDIVIGRANSYCELVVDLLAYINLILFLVNLGILCKFEMRIHEHPTKPVLVCRSWVWNKEYEKGESVRLPAPEGFLIEELDVGRCSACACDTVDEVPPVPPRNVKPGSKVSAIDSDTA